MPTNKDLHTIVAVHTEKLDVLDSDIKEIKSDMKQHMLMSAEANDKLNDKIDSKMDRLLYWFMGGMGTVILLLAGKYF